MKKERMNKKRSVCVYLPWWVRLARVPEQASVSRPGHFIDRSWDLASALLCQGDFKSQSPAPWERRERSWAVCSACGVENKPLAGKHGQTHNQPHPQLCRAAVSSDQLFCLWDSWALKTAQPLSPPHSSHGWLPLLCRELSQLARQPAAQSGTPFPDSWLTLFCLCLSHPSDPPAVESPAPAVRSRRSSNQHVGQFD